MIFFGMEKGNTLSSVSVGGPLYFKFIHIVFRTSRLQYKLYTWQRNICSYVWFSSSPNSKSDDHPLRCNFVEDIQGTQKDGLQHGGDR